MLFCGTDRYQRGRKMAQCATQMRAMTSCGMYVKGVVVPENSGVGSVGIVAASRLASASQAWRSAAVARLRVGVAGRVESPRQSNLVSGGSLFSCVFLCRRDCSQFSGWRTLLF